MKAKIYVGAKKYALYIGRKIVQKTLEFLTLPARFISKKVQELKNLTMYGQSIQNGTPTPTTPVEIESVGERTKNLFDKDTATLDYYLDVSGTPIYAVGRQYSDYIPVKTNTNYTISLISQSELNTLRIHYYNANKQWIKQGYITGYTPSVGRPFTYTFTTDSTPTYIRFGGWQHTKIQLEEGDTATPYEPYGYKVPVEIATKGQNIFNKDKALLGYTINAQGVITPSDTYNCSNYVSVEYGKTYIRLNNTSPLGATYHLFNADKVWLGSKVAPSGDGTMVIDNTNCKYIVIAIAKTVSLDTYQIIEGTTPKPYEPYQYTTTNIYLPEPLRKIGNYADVMSVDGTDVTVVRNVGGKLFNGTENYWTIASGNYFSVLKTSIGTNSTILPSGSQNAISSRFGNSNSRVDLKFSVGGSYINFVYDALNYDVSTWTNWLSNNNVEFVYPLATPTTETYTIEQPIQLEQGTLTLDIDTNIKPSKINITGDIDNE